jgi:alkylated DNA repair dioxygenase AlkB
MKLFESSGMEHANLLPYDGCAIYYGRVLGPVHADDYLHQLLTGIEWRHDEALIFGRHIITKRKVAWYGDASYTYTYSNITRQALSWTPLLLELKQLAERYTGDRFNSCLLNLYHDGKEGMAWHSDDEKDLQKNGTIASLSFGAERKFAFRHKRTKETRALQLEHGSLLAMKNETQSHWLHRLPPSARIAAPRVNLTFRKMAAGPL